MRNDQEVVHIKEDGTVTILSRSAPKKTHHRWAMTEQFARMLLRGNIAKTLMAFDRYGLWHVFESTDHPEDGVIGIREKP